MGVLSFFLSFFLQEIGVLVSVGGGGGGGGAVICGGKIVADNPPQTNCCREKLTVELKTKRSCDS